MAEETIVSTEERVARALYEAIGDSDADWEAVHPDTQHYRWKVAARAAIAAMSSQPPADMAEIRERVQKLVNCFDKFSDDHRMLGDSLLLGDLRALLTYTASSAS